MDSKERIEDNDVNPEFLQKLPLSFVKNNFVFPLKMKAGRLIVAIGCSKSLYALDDIGRIFSVQVTPLRMSQKAITEAIHKYYDRLSGSAQKVVSEINEDSLEAIAHRWDEPKDLIDLTDEAPIIKLLNSLLFQAVKERASDIHIEPYEREIDVRFRRDGILYSIISPPKLIQDALVSRVKIMSKLDIAEKRLPQDGRIRLLVAGNDIDVRVSIVPTAFGERVVLRLLDRRSGSANLTEIGLNVEQVNTMYTLLLRSNGIILVTGPTGSGKTTTLYALLNILNSAVRNIITVEDPIEYQLKGIGQIQVNTKIGISFASGLRSILRQDPDVIMVGEIRDPETAEMAIQASLTGHLVLSTLHTNDAPSAVSRLINMGVQPFLLSSSLSAVLTQRLVRVLCKDCKSEYVPLPQERDIFGDCVPDRLWKGRGCAKCLNTGYSGRTGIFEFMTIDSEMSNVFLKNPDSKNIKKYALSSGMRTLREDGLIKAASGITSFEEVIRVTQND